MRLLSMHPSLCKPVLTKFQNNSSDQNQFHIFKRGIKIKIQSKTKNSMSKLPQYIHAMCIMCVFKKRHYYEFHHKKKHWMVRWYHSYVDFMCVADNVLLSEDGRQCFLCDFGLSETLNQSGYSTKTFRGDYPHTHTSMHVYYEVWFMVCVRGVCREHSAWHWVSYAAGGGEGWSSLC